MAMNAEVPWSSTECKQAHGLVQHLAGAALTKRSGADILLGSLQQEVKQLGFSDLQSLFDWLQQNCPELITPSEQFGDMDWSDLW